MFKLNPVTLTLNIFDLSVGQPAGFCQCYYQDIVPQGMAFDAVYYLGSLMRHKLHMQLPATSQGVSCQPLLSISAFLLVGGVKTSLPYFMTLD